VVGLAAVLPLTLAAAAAALGTEIAIGGGTEPGLSVSGANESIELG